jgi:hypothetical protein
MPTKCSRDRHLASSCTFFQVLSTHFMKMSIASTQDRGSSAQPHPQFLAVGYRTRSRQQLHSEPIQGAASDSVLMSPWQCGHRMTGSGSGCSRTASVLGLSAFIGASRSFFRRLVERTGVSEGETGAERGPTPAVHPFPSAQVYASNAAAIRRRGRRKAEN